MKRLLFISIFGVFLFSIAAGIYLLFKRPSADNYRLARGRAFLDTENYLAALQELREVSQTRQNPAAAHAFLGAAYFRLHLYLTAIREFEEAGKHGSRRADPWIGLASTYIELGDGHKALENAKRAATIDKKSSDAWITLGRAHWLQRNFDEAEKAALRAQQLDPQHSAIEELLLRNYFDRDQTDKFQATLDRLKNPSKAVQDLAVRFFVRQGRWAKAYETKTAFERASLERSVIEIELTLQRESDRTDLYPTLVKNLVKLSRYDDALEAARRYRGPVSLDLEVGKAYVMTGQTAAAIQAWQRASRALVHKLSAEVLLTTITGDIRHWREAYKAERIEPDHFVLAKLEPSVGSGPPAIRALIYRYAGIYDTFFYNRAAGEALKTLEQDPKNLDALFTIGTAYHRLGRSDDATRYMEQAKELYPNNAEVWSRLGNLAIQEHDANKVLDPLKKAVELDPTNPSTLYNLGWVYDQTGNVTQAISLYQRAIHASPLSFEAMNNLGLIYDRSGQPERAIELLRRAINTDPENEAGYYNLGNYYARQRDLKTALRNYDRVLEISPASAEAAVEKGRILIELGRPESAVETLNRALESNSTLFDAYFVLSSAYEKMGRIKEAIAAAEEAERIRPSSTEVKQVIGRLEQCCGK